MARKQSAKAVAASKAVATTRAAPVKAASNGDVVGRQHEQQMELMRTVYNEAPETVWQGAATRALEVNALLMAAVVGEQRRAEQERSNRNELVSAADKGDSDDDDDEESGSGSSSGSGSEEQSTEPDETDEYEEDDEEDEEEDEEDEE